MPTDFPRIGARTILAMALMAAGISPAAAHVKWFAPYIVGAEPRPLADMLHSPYVGSGFLLVLVFFAATRVLEGALFGHRIISLLDLLSAPLWRRRDDFAVAMIAGFFIAIFAVGGVYLTPDLKTASGWISWAQLAIAVFAFSRRTMPLSAIGIVGLWVVALREYELFHLMDYLALGLGIAAYLGLAAMPGHRLHQHRFLVLRWAVAISLMWSSLEKFAYPEWFYPLVIEKPFLTFGLPRDMFIPMAGVAEFTLGFGLLWTPLVRRLSAIALLVIFTAAIYPFGRMDLIGHALIMLMLVSILIQPGRETGRHVAMLGAIGRIPASLGAALVAFTLSYWGLHDMLYTGGGSLIARGTLDTHASDHDHPHVAGQGLTPEKQVVEEREPETTGP